MDKERAKFILQSFRPDGADATDADFAEALRLATQDRELATWLAEERAHDALFVEALNTIEVPKNLRDEVLCVMESDGDTSENNEIDGLLTGALTSIQPPAGLRNQILSAMEMQRDSMPSAAKDESLFQMNKWWVISAIAALLLIGILINLPHEPVKNPEQTIAMKQVQLQSGALIQASHELELDVREHSLASVNAWLESKNLPQVEAVPHGLIDVDIYGGRTLILDNGVKASLVFFKKKDLGNLYLMVLKSDDVENFDSLKEIKQISLKECRECPVHHFHVLTWRDGNRAYMLLSMIEKTKLVELF